MDHEHLMPDESILTYSDNGLVTLTTHRIRYANKIWGQSNHISMMLENVSAIQVVYLSYPFLWIIGVVIGLIGLLITTTEKGGGPEMFITGFLAFFLIVGYFISRRHIFSITADGGTKIIFRTENVATAAMIDLMNKIETAKADRLSLVNNTISK